MDCCWCPSPRPRGHARLQCDVSCPGINSSLVFSSSRLVHPVGLFNRTSSSGAEGRQTSCNVQRSWVGAESDVCGQMSRFLSHWFVYRSMLKIKPAVKRIGLRRSFHSPHGIQGGLRCLHFLYFIKKDQLFEHIMNIISERILKCICTNGTQQRKIINNLSTNLRHVCWLSVTSLRKRWDDTNLIT